MYGKVRKAHKVVTIAIQNEDDPTNKDSIKMY